jgi:hypothetical protein
MNTTENYRQLGYAVALKAAKDFFKTASKKKKEEILKDLKSSWMDFITNGISVILAEKLETSPSTVERGLNLYGSEEN